MLQVPGFWNPCPSGPMISGVCTPSYLAVPQVHAVHAAWEADQGQLFEGYCGQSVEMGSRLSTYVHLNLLAVTVGAACANRTWAVWRPHWLSHTLMFRRTSPKSLRILNLILAFHVIMKVHSSKVNDILYLIVYYINS